MAQYLNMVGVEALWAKIKNTFALKSHSHSNYVTTDTAQTITGTKTFNNGDQSPITLVRSSSDFVSVRFDGSSGILGYLGFMGVDQPMYRRVSDNVYLNLLHSGNSSVSKSGESLTVTINGVSKTLTNTNTTYSTATSGALGLVKIGYTANGKNYPVELSNGQMYVNVPWTDTDTNTWRPVTNTYTGSDTSTCVSQKGTNDLYNALVNGYASSAGYASGITRIDDRSDNTDPYGDVKGQVTWHLKTNSSVGLPSTQTYSGVMILSPWDDSSGGAEHWLAFNSNGSIYHRYGTSSWSAWKTLCYTDHTHTSFANSITVTGSVSASSGFYQSSDERLKTFHDPIEVNLDKLKTLRKNYFNFNDSDKLEIGVSAQEVQEIYPELVTSDDNGYLSVAYDKLSVIALKAIDELDNKYQKEINDLNDQLSTIKNILKEKGIL